MFLVVRGKSLLSYFVALVIMVVGCMSISESASAYVFLGANAKRQLPIYSVATEDKKIAITFDAAWGADDTLNIIQVLDQYKVKATFFLVGFWVDKFPDEVKALSQAGHEIGTHSDAHNHMPKMSKANIVSDLQASIDKIKTVTGTTPTVFRPPYGDYNNMLIATAREIGLEPIQWSIDSLDWKGLDKTQLIERVTKRLHNGGIILCHNNSDHIVEALPGILSYAIEQGYTFTTVSELIYHGDSYIDNNGVQHISGV